MDRPTKKVKTDEFNKFQQEIAMYDQLINRLKTEEEQIREQMKSQNMEYNESLLQDRFNQAQIKQLLRTLESIKKYSDLISAQIQHQMCSISTLRPEKIKKYPQLGTRHRQMLDRGTKNIIIIKEMLIPYRLMIQSNQTQQKFMQSLTNNQGKDHGHSHGHNHWNHEMVVNMFHQMVREWSNQADLQYVRRVIGYIDNCWKNEENSQRSQQGQKDKKVLVVGSGMGRILAELRHHPDLGHRISHLQGHENDPQNYLWAEYFLNHCTRQLQIHPYIHNFCNYLKTSSPYRSYLIPSSIPDHSLPYPLTLGNFFNSYKTHHQQWHCIVTLFTNYHIQDVLKHIRLIYNMLAEGGVWIDVSTANFGRNVVGMCYREYEEVLEKSLFKVVEKGESNDYWYGDRECMMNQKRVSYYRVMVK